MAKTPAPAAATKAPVAKKSVGKKVAADGEKKKKKSKSVETYKIYLYKVLKQVRLLRRAHSRTLV
jgi:histone H2B